MSKRDRETDQTKHKVKAEHTKIYCQWDRERVQSMKRIFMFYLKTICQCRVFAPYQHWFSRNGKILGAGANMCGGCVRFFFSLLILLLFVHT